ncbi:MFS transporter [Actinocorallia sp. A-T 12471]|uniref:MFS transporter n=1 Tax=Actinocorallia sp. A-T 12471 TaxID=3089813 RepID=UPI0029CDA94B|nr:MFS transporter [Actinocorallia sp. A-T 12471]MDX6739385.1 MFS transporter [Actinocorallia sp. A-T 12471]
MTAPSSRADVVRFAVVWTTSLLSSVGSALSSFVLGVWVYQTTGSVTGFALVMLAAMLPPVLLGPLAGAVADRFDRRRVLLGADAVSGVATATLALLVHTGGLRPWHVCVAAAVSAAAGAFHFTAYQAMTPLLIPARHLGRANGLMQLGMAAQIAAPAVAAGLLTAVGTTGVLVLDLVSFAVAVSVLATVRLPARVLRPARTEPPKPLRADLAHGWRYLRARPPLLALALVFTGYNFIYGLAGVLVQPLILGFASATTLGLLMLAGGSGVFAGSLVMGAWGGPRNRMPGISLFMFAGAVALALHAVRPSPLLVGCAAAVFLFTLPIVQGCGRTLFQTKVEPASLGRVSGTVQALGQVAQPVAYLAAGPLSERVAEPLLADGGALAGSVGALTGTGPGRGVAALFLAAAVLLALLAAATALAPALRTLETALPDALDPETADAR